jgi:tRNA(Glu) U13 pseudouridine synthase TruD
MLLTRPISGMSVCVASSASLTCLIFQSPAGKEITFFWQKLGEVERNYWQALKLPTAGRKPCFQDELSGQLFSELLAEKGLTLSSFRTRVLRLVGFRSFLRPAAAFPKNLKIIEAGDDELYPHWKKITLSFELGRGSYATILVKRLSLQPGNASLSLIDSPAD